VKVSWQITGVRQDAYAKSHPLVVEQQKEARLGGHYIHSELYGAPPEKQIEWARNPQLMKRMKDIQEKQAKITVMVFHSFLVLEIE
jgi:trimeric autotransporter adhesin